MKTGLVFDLQEFAVHDGPGIRTVVFLKGCPLRCSWCHNPEGQRSESQIMRGESGERVTGKVYTSDTLASILNEQAVILRSGEGGVTFSGGEPLQQAGFVAEVISLLEEVHTILETSGYGRESDFKLLLESVDAVYFDITLILHQIYCF
jgi:pyruvate formate lyase activating enzyme